MKHIIKFLSDLYENPVLVWLLGTIIAILCLIVALGLKGACGLFAIWIFATLIAYTARRNNWI